VNKFKQEINPFSIINQLNCESNRVSNGYQLYKEYVFDLSY